VLILNRRRAARRADSALTTVVHRGGEGCCSTRGSKRKLENETLMRHYAIGQRRIEHGDDLVVAFARLGHGDVQTAKLLRHADRGADFQPAAG
jgi:hypothetical protein